VAARLASFFIMMIYPLGAAQRRITAFGGAA